MGEEVSQVVLAIALSALSTGLNSVRLLANRGLLSPADVEDVANSLTVHLRQPDGEVAPHLQMVEAVLDSHVGPALAEIRRAAAANWKAQ